jgi:hypothetical protein
MQALSDMKILTSICLFFLCTASWADSACLLSGKFENNVEKTLADYSAHNLISGPEEEGALMELFSSTTHEWRCTELRVSSYGYVALWEDILITQRDPHSLLVSFADSDESDLTLIFEETCYKIKHPEINYHDYFCPTKE